MITNLARGVRTFTSNAFLVTGERTVLVDVGANFPIAEAVREHADQLDAVVLTHTHPDHIGNLADVREAFSVNPSASSDSHARTEGSRGVETWGFDPDNEAVDRAIADGETVRLGDHAYTAYHTPGHKNDHLCLYSSRGVLFTGDLVFQNGSFGRTDLPEGDREKLVESIARIESVVDEDLRELHPGHGRSVEDDPFLDIRLARQAAEMY